MSSSHKEKCSWEWPAGSGNKRSRRPRSAPRLRPSSSVYSYSSRRPKPPRDSKSFKRKWRPGAPRSKSWLSPPDRRPSSWPPTERCCARCATPTRRSASPNERPRRLALRRMATAEPPEHGRSQSEENGASVATLRRGQRSDSLSAIANAKAICNEHFASKHELEIVDLLEHPKRALADRI